MKKVLSVLLALTMCLSVMTFTVSAADTLKDVELPKPATPNYFVVNQDFSGTHNDYITMYAAFDDSLVKLYTEYDVDSEAFFKKYGIENAKTGDIIVLAGKGHEDYQEIRGVKYHMDEREIIADIFDSLS